MYIIKEGTRSLFLFYYTRQSGKARIYRRLSLLCGVTFTIVNSVL